MSYFRTTKVSEGYAKSRPYFHPEVIKRIRAYLGLKYKYQRALDVGCGAGLSTLALKEIAESVVGVDSSEAMIDSAIKDERIEYFNYPAEYLPFDQDFELITLAGSINWIERVKFFREAKMILSHGGFVIIYDNNILGIMEEDRNFEDWYLNRYLKKFPKPPRDESPITKEEARGYGFDFDHSETYTNNVAFSIDGFMDYLFTQSEITVALENKKSEQIRNWLARSLTPFFQSQKRTLLFGGYIWYLKNV
jgi:SAM-dependent methyltransferase